MSKRSKPKLDLKIGDLVLIGRPGVSMPGHWLMVTVICVAGAEIGTEHTPAGQSQPYRQFFDIGEIRAVGSYRFLREFQERARLAVADRERQVDEATQALGRARDAVWAKLDEIAAAEPPVEAAGGFV